PATPRSESSTCPAVQTRPPATTAALMRGPGLMYRIEILSPEPAGLDIISVTWQISNMAKSRSTGADVEIALRAIANDRRLLILHWLKNPRAHFPKQADGDLLDDCVCGLLIADKLGVSQPTVSEHLRVLAQAGILRGKRIKQWTFY